MPLDIGQNIKRLRKEAGLSQEKLAEKLGVTNQAVSKWESGRSLPDVALVVTIAALFGVTADTLLTSGVADEQAEAWSIHTEGYVEIGLEKRMEIFRQGLEKLPRSGQLLADAINTGFQLAQHYQGRDEAQATRYFTETAKLCNRQLERSHDPGEINYARFILAVLYALFGKDDDASRLISQFPTYDAAVSSGAVKAAITRMSGDTAAEVSARMDNLMQILLSVTNEVAALNTAVKKLVRNEKGDGMGEDLVWTAEMTHPKHEGLISSMSFSGDFLYYKSFAGNASHNYRENLKSGETEELFASGETRGMEFFACLPDGTACFSSVINETDMLTIIIEKHIGKSGIEDAVLTTKPTQRSTRMLSGNTPYAIDGAGNIYVCFHNAVEVYDKSGEPLFSLNLQDRSPMNMVRFPDGRIAVLMLIMHPLSDPTQIYGVYPINLSKKAVDEPIPVGQFRGNIYSGSGKYLFFYIAVNSCLIGYNSDTKACEKLFSCTALNINCHQVEAINMADDGRVRIASYIVRPKGTTVELATVSRKPKAPDTRVTLEYAVYILNQTPREKIAEFNRTNARFQIHVTEYRGDVINANNLEEGTMRMLAAIRSDNPPDIIDLACLPEEYLAKRGCLADLYPLLDSDGELSRSSFMAAPLKTLETDGKLYYIMVEYLIHTMAARRDAVGDNPTMTLDELAALMDAHPGTYLVHDRTSRSALAAFLVHFGGDFIDWKNCACSFTNPDFRQLLELAGRFPKIDPRSIRYSENNPIGAFTDSEALLENVSLHRTEELQHYRETLGTDLVFKAFPARRGNGNVFSPVQLYAIGARCKNKDVAWRFIKDILITGIFPLGFPLLKSAFYERLEESMTERYIEGAGKTPVATKDDADKVLALIDSTGKAAGEYNALYALVLNSAQPYFDGEITAEEATYLIQANAERYLETLK